MRALLGDELVLDSVGAVVALPGAAAQARHKDGDFIFPFPLAATLPAWAVTLVVPLVPLGPRNGPTALVPGSHRRDGSDARDQIDLPRTALGDGYLMDYRLSHWGMPNASEQARPILYLVYARPWFSDERNFRGLRKLAVPDAEALAPEVRRLVRRAV